MACKACCMILFLLVVVVLGQTMACEYGSWRVYRAVRVNLGLEQVPHYLCRYMDLDNRSKGVYNLQPTAGISFV